MEDWTFMFFVHVANKVAIMTLSPLVVRYYTTLITKFLILLLSVLSGTVWYIVGNAKSNSLP